MAGLIEKAKNLIAENIADIPKPEASIEDVDLKGVANDGVTYNACIGVSNPYPHSIPICEISYLLKSNARTILSGNMADPGSLTAKETTKINIPMKVPHSIIVSLAKDICYDWDIDYELEIGLTIDLPIVGNFTIPLSNKGEIKLPSIKDLWTGGDEEEEKE